MENALSKVQWYTALPEKCCAVLLQKLQQMPAGEMKRKDCKVVIEMGQGEKQTKPLTAAARLNNDVARNEINYSIKRLDSAKPVKSITVSIPIPEVAKPKFNSRRKLLSREGKRVTLELNSVNFEAFNEIPQRNADPRQTLQKSYSVKYCGVTDGQIGILTRKIPITSLYRKPFLKKRFPKVVLSKPKKVQDLLATPPAKEEDENTLMKSREELVESEKITERDMLDPEYIPISAVNVEQMNSLPLNPRIEPLPTKPILVKKKTHINTSLPNKRPPKTVLSEIVQGVCCEKTVPAPSVRNINTSHAHFRNFLKTQPVQRLSCTTTHGKKSLAENFAKAISHNSIIHTYSLPRGLTVCRKPPLAASEPTEDRYNKQTIHMAVHNKIAGVQYTVNKGFKGHTLSTAELKKAIGYFTRLDKKQNVPANWNKTVIQKASQPSIMFQNSFIKERSTQPANMLNGLPGSFSARERRNEVNKKGLEKALKREEDIKTADKRELYLEYLQYKHKN